MAEESKNTSSESSQALSESMSLKGNNKEENGKGIPRDKKDLAAFFPSREELLKEIDQNVPEFSKEEHDSDKEKHKDSEISDEDDSEAENEHKYSETERKALEKGWVPKEEYKGDPNEWKSAKEFLDRGQLFERISNQNRELKKMQAAYDSILDLVKKQSEMLSNDKAEKVLAQKREAIEAGDVDSAEKYEDQYNEIKKEAESFKELQLKTQANSEIPEEVEEFIERNKEWYNGDNSENYAMVQYAVRKEAELMERYPSWPLIRRLEETEKMVKAFFKDKFENPNIHKAGLVERSTPRVKKDPSKITFDDLPEEAKKIVKNFIRQDRTGKISKDEYAQQLVMIGAVKI